MRGSNGGGDGDVANAGDVRDEAEGGENEETADAPNGEEEDVKAATKPESRDASPGDENGRQFPHYAVLRLAPRAHIYYCSAPIK